jgi:lipopolysaccharide biosynthesis regulator YciM
MSFLSKGQWIALLSVVLLGIALWFAPKKSNKSAEAENKQQTSANGFSFESLEDSIKKIIEPNVLSQIVLFEQNLSKSSNSQGRISAFDSLSTIWKNQKQLGLSGWYKSQAALLKNTPQELAKAGELCYSLARFSSPKERPLLMQQAITCLEKSYEKDSTQTSVKVSLASCYVEGSPNPMKGIMMLRDVVQKDSTNFQAQVQLGLFAMQSGQCDKAVDRFKRLQKIVPTNNEVDLYLAQAYAESGKKNDAIVVLNEFLKKSKDQVINAQVNDYIKQLKTTN